MPGDTDISHAVEARLLAIEARLDALDGGGVEEAPPDELQLPDLPDTGDKPEDATPKRARSRYSATSEGTE